MVDISTKFPLTSLDVCKKLASPQLQRCIFLTMTPNQLSPTRFISWAPCNLFRLILMCAEESDEFDVVDCGRGLLIELELDFPE
jgi:hypothetical protein